MASMAAFIGAGLVFSAAYFIVDLYFVSRLGPQALAGVGAAGNFSFLAIAASQLVGVGSLSLISQSVGRRDTAYANLVFNQVCGLSLLMTAGDAGRRLSVGGHGRPRRWGRTRGVRRMRTRLPVWIPAFHGLRCFR